MRYISEIKLTELVKNFVEELNRTRDIKEKKNKIFALLSYFETPYLEEIEKQKKLAEKNQQLKKILRDIWNINSHGNMEYFGESVMEILNNANKSLWEEK